MPPKTKIWGFRFFEIRKSSLEYIVKNFFFILEGNVSGKLPPKFSLDRTLVIAEILYLHAKCCCIPLGHLVTWEALIKAPLQWRRPWSRKYWWKEGAFWAYIYFLGVAFQLDTSVKFHFCVSARKWQHSQHLSAALTLYVAGETPAPERRVGCLKERQTRAKICC